MSDEAATVAVASVVAAATAAASAATAAAAQGARGAQGARDDAATDPDLDSELDSELDSDSDPVFDPVFDAAAAATPPAAGRQLRILSGMHAGARAMLTGEQYVLGASEECDFVLLDALVQPRHAMLSLREGCWHLDWVAEAGAEPVLAPMRLDAGMAVPLGPIVIAVDAPESPWPTLEQLVLVPHAPALEPQLPLPAATQVPDPAARGGAFGNLFARGALATAIAATACLSALGMVVTPMIREHRAHDASAARAASAAVAAASAASAASAAASAATGPEAQQRAALEAVLRDVGFASRARIESGEGGWVVQAGVVTEPESDMLRSALGRVKPRPMLRMTAEEDLRDAMADALNRLGAEFRGKLAYRYVGEGKVRVEGRIAPGTDAQRLARSLAAEFPQVREWEHAVDTGQKQAEEFVAQLRSVGWQVDGDWNGEKLALHVTLQQRDVPKWEQTLVAAAQARGPGQAVPFTATLEFAAAAHAPAAVPKFVVEGKPPFDVRSVVGGDSPYVLLEGGAKLAPGGVLNGWKLTAIAANQLVFENGARRATVPR